MKKTKNPGENMHIYVNIYMHIYYIGKGKLLLQKDGIQVNEMKMSK